MKALITGITGQDGSYLAEFLLEKGYDVYGIVRRVSTPNLSRIANILDKITLLDGDLLDQSSVDEIVTHVKPDEIYNLAAQSFVPTSFKQPSLTADVTAVGVTKMLEAMRRFAPKARFYQASSSEMFGNATTTPQNETTPFHPRSPYGSAKVYGHHATVNYREAYGLYAVSGICFNHDSPRRGLEFVTRKITNAAARIKLGQMTELKMGNLAAKRDVGFAGDYVKAMWLMLQQPRADDYVIATGKAHSVEEMLDVAFNTVGIHWQDFVKLDEALYRPAEIHLLEGDASKIKSLGWRHDYDFKELIEMMVLSDLEAVKC